MLGPCGDGGRGAAPVNRAFADSLVALGIFVTSLVVGAVVLVGGLLLAARTMGNHADPTARSSAADFLVVRGRLSCDSEVTEEPEPVMDGEPSALRICAGPEGSMPWTAPADVVEGDLTPLLRILADLEPAPDEPYACTFQGGPAYDLLIRFSGTTYARVRGDTGGCGVVTSNGNDYFGADEVLDTVLAMVEEQRDQRPEPTAIPDPPDCPVDRGLGPAYSLTGEVTEMVVAVSCWRPDARELAPFGDPVPVPARQLEALLADVGQNGQPLEMPGDYDCPGGPKELYMQTLVGRTAWGDLIALSGTCREFYVDVWSQRTGDDPPRVWRPTPRSQRILDDLRR
jgi:hypothetical protein